MFGLSVRFYLKTIQFLDTISGIGLLSHKQTFLNQTKLVHSILASVLATMAALSHIGDIFTRSSNKLLHTYSSFSGFLGLIFCAILVIELSLRSLNKKRALLEAELVHWRISVSYDYVN